MLGFCTFVLAKLISMKNIDSRSFLHKLGLVIMTPAGFADAHAAGVFLLKGGEK